MKLDLLLFATVTLANLVANPLPNDESAIPVTDELFPHQNPPCQVTGRGSVYVCIFLLKIQQP
jgi:hypothetical protein